MSNATPNKILRLLDSRSEGGRGLKVLILSFLLEGEMLPVKRNLKSKPLDTFAMEDVFKGLQVAHEQRLICELEINEASGCVRFDLP